MASFLVRALDLPAGSSSFTDIDSSIHKADIAALASAGITAGCNPPANTLYCPTDPVTREQMASFLARGLELDISPRIVVTADQGLLGVEMGTSETETVAALTTLFGAPTADIAWSCPYVVAPNMRRVSWGSLSVTVFTRDTGSGLGLAGWRYALLGGSAEPGGPAASHIELPFGLELFDPIGDAVTATGNSIMTTPFSFTEVDLGYGAVEAEGTSIDPNASITGVHQGFGHSCE
ncbi:MAG: S-layer homology domain-containing protein [bacterium]|nr:S-layer homology domain-containing protein [bacterium]